MSSHVTGSSRRPVAGRRGALTLFQGQRPTKPGCPVKCEPPKGVIDGTMNALMHSLYYETRC